VFSDLLGHPEVTEETVLAGRVGIMALHAGIESGTGMLAHRMAERTGASRYVVTQSDALRWHVPSAHYDPRESRSLASFLDHVTFAISLHGFGREHLPKTVLVGGGDTDLQQQFAPHLRRTTSVNVLAGDDVPPGLRGRHPHNPVNLVSGGGIQLEMSALCRENPLADQLIDSMVQFVDELRS
jgi:phage replication-related protein YjqB (UPF0714/DUF867 family)